MADRTSQGAKRGLTAPQMAALVTLAHHAGEWVGGHKRQSRETPTPLVNMRAAGTLVRLGLADRQMPTPEMWNPYSCRDRFHITEAGKDAAADA